MAQSFTGLLGLNELININSFINIRFYILSKLLQKPSNGLVHATPLLASALLVAGIVAMESGPAASASCYIVSS